MADKIRLLPEVVANQIAAGEVVNRPASVVKEMMENAIDAGATSVKVNFRDGGKDLIQIVDDGCGMSPIDARMAFDRHATSKIGAVEDIYALHTFGFRGEALASIAAVSQVELRTRQAGDEVGTQTEINGGQFAAQNPVMCPVGSQFFVRNLFYNVPARRRFLDKSTTSASQIKAEFQRIALCNPQIAFELYANDAPVYTLQAGSLAGRIVDVVGRHIKQNLLEVEADTSIACIEGYIGRPAAAKKRNTEQYLFVNGRFFKSTYLTSAILKAYEKLIPESCQPSYFLYLTLDPGRIDVNVHPQKTEVKFADEEAVWQIVNAAVRETPAKTGAAPLTEQDGPRMRADKSPPSTTQDAVKKGLLLRIHQILVLLQMLPQIHRITLIHRHNLKIRTPPQNILMIPDLLLHLRQRCPIIILLMCRALDLVFYTILHRLVLAAAHIGKMPAAVRNAHHQLLLLAVPQLLRREPL